MHLLVGDLQGCCSAFDRLLQASGFSASRDSLTVLGDVVNRGPQSLATVRRLMALEGSAQALLGNHDLHLLAVAQGVRPPHASDTLQDILQAPDREQLLHWIAQRPLALQAHGWLCVHAGVALAWNEHQTLALAEEVSQLLRGPNAAQFLPSMYGNEPARWDDQLQGADRWRCIINTLTRARFCTEDGTLDFKLKESASLAPEGLKAWFDWPQRATKGVPIAFGHWSTLGLINRQDLLALDTGCVWGGALTAVRVDGGRREVFQVSCETAQQPGASSPA